MIALVFQAILSRPAAAGSSASLEQFFVLLGPTLFAFGWMLEMFLILWVAWETYRMLKMNDYISGVQWTFLQIKLPDTSEETPRSMETAYDIWGGIHKSPDLNELYFDGYLEPWYSCEIQIKAGQVRYIMVVPTAHRRIFEGVIYGQYPKAEITEVEDYAQRYNWHDLRQTFDIYGTQIVLVDDDIYPVKSYKTYETPLAENDRYTDPHQGLVEALSAVGPGEEFWYQVVIRPQSGAAMKEWKDKGEAAVMKISGQAKKEEPGMFAQIRDFFLGLPGEVLSTFMKGPAEESQKREELKLRFFNPVDNAKMEGILQKISQNSYKVVIRGVHIAPPGQLQKPNIGRVIGGFKQFNTLNLNSFKPDESTKTNGPNYILRDIRRKFRERSILLKYQWRDMYGPNAGQWLSSEELATIYHFPVNYVRAPGVERSKAGQQSPPANLPYA